MHSVAALRIGWLTARRRLLALGVVSACAAIGVAALLATFAIAFSFADTAARGVNPNRRVVLRPSAANEDQSALPRDVVDVVMARLPVRRTASGEPIASANVLAFVQVQDSKGRAVSVAVRGVGPRFASVYPEIHLLAGRWPRAGIKELMAGRGLAARLGDLTIGSDIEMPTGKWRVVGLFSSNGDPHESELIGDAESVMAAFHKDSFNSISYLPPAAGPSPEALTQLFQHDAVQAEVNTESRVFQASYRFVKDLLYIAAYGVGSVIAVALLLGILNTLLITVRKRATELATLRALGFDRGALILSVVAEATVCGIVGGGVGALLVRMLFERSQISVYSGVEVSQLTFDMHIGLALIGISLGVTFLIALTVGGIAALQVFSMTPATTLRRA